MCGLFGAISKKGPFPEACRRQFIAATDCVAHRGPDAAGYLAFNSLADLVPSPSDFTIFLGSRRLSIIDLSEAGKMPMQGVGGRWIVFNGEIFNYVELRADLVREGYRFASDTDTEVILAVYERYGLDGFRLLNGMWAFAILDPEKQLMVLSRDRFSMKPLYYYDTECALYFASEIKQLLPFVQHRRINKNRLFQYLTQGLADHTDETLFDGIRSVKPKHSLLVDLRIGSRKEHKYWDYCERAKGLSLPAAIEEFRWLFEDSVRIRLRSDVPLGALVSGGLDSSAIAVTANRLLGGTLQTYSVVSNEYGFDERSYIQLLAETGVQNTCWCFEVGHVMEALSDVTYINDEPPPGFQVIAHHKLLEWIRKNTDIVVLLSGQGGDETLMGYSKYFYFVLQELMRRGAVVSAGRQLWSSLVNRTTVTQFRLAEAMRYLPRIRWSENSEYVLLRGDSEQLGLQRGLRARQCDDLDRFSVPILAHYEDRTSMRNSLEIRTPFLDHRLVDCLINLPVETKVHDGWLKYILRAAQSDLPDGIRWRRDKQGFLTPEAHWLRHELRDKILEMFHHSCLQQLGVIDDAKFLRRYRGFLEGARHIWYADISRVVLAEMWARRLGLTG